MSENYSPVIDWVTAAAYIVQFVVLSVAFTQALQQFNMVVGDFSTLSRNS